MVLTDQQFRSHVEEMSDGCLKCNFCEHIFAVRTSISRIKWHFSGVKGRGVAICPQVPRDVQEEAFLATDGANKRLKTMPSSSNNEVGYATSISPQEQSNENANLVRDGERILMEERNLSSVEAGIQIENRGRETSQPLQSSYITPERPPVVEHETRGAAVQPTDLVGSASEKNWDEILALSQKDPVLINGPNTTISTSLQLQKDEEAEADPLAALPLLFGKLVSEWESRLLQIRALLDDAEQKQPTNQAMKVWLDKLRDLAYDVEDTLDEFETEAWTCKLKSAESQACTSTVQPSAAMPNGSKLQAIDDRWKDIVKEKSDLGLDINVIGRSNKASRRVQTTSLVKEPKVYGRENAKQHLVQFFMKDEPSNTRYSVIPIVGMGGIGKTTLAQVVYNDKRVEFDYKAWACVSDDFDITRLTKSILRERTETDDLNELQEQLKEKLHGKKFLIVLDDVWQHGYEDWTTLCAPFAAGAPGSKIIITTRGKDVALRIGSVVPYMLKELPYDECLCLFAQHALDKENFDANPDLKEVGQKIVQRCKGLPLAAKTLGGLLRHKQKLEDWEDIENSEIWELSEGKSVILSALRLSYHHLPSHLRRCFAYCAIFPKDYEFDENELVLLWMAEGFLQRTEQKKQGKDLGHKYFKDLLSRSLFQECSAGKSRYVMHDLISDLAQSVSGEICFHLDDKNSRGPTSYAKVRHLSFTSHCRDTSQRFAALYEMESLRTFLAIPRAAYGLSFLSNKVLDDLVPKLKCLRALSLASYIFEELPRSIGALKHLRYLNLSHTSVVRLPESLGELLNLQTLILCRCRRLRELPAWIGNLINLQHLDIHDTQQLQKMPLEICKLKNLRFMPKFVIGDGSGLGIGELRRLPDLQGQLHIEGLHNVTDIRDAKMVNLKERHGLGEVAMGWSYDFDDARNESHEKQVLRSLEPPRNLEMLSIISYGGTEFPSWVGDPSFSKMVKLRLSACRKSTSLPSLVKLPALKHLRIEGMDKLRGMAVENFPSLESLHIGDMLEWEQWYWSNGPNEEPGGKFPKLVELTLKNCPKLIGKLPRCLPSLKKLHISRCCRLANLPERLPSLPELQVGNCDEVIFRMVPDFSSLTTLAICKISGLVGLQKAFVEALIALEDLEINKCSKLKYLWQYGVDLDKLANLKRLKIFQCKQLVSLVEGAEGILPYTLKSLQLEWCNSMKSLPDGMMTVVSSNNSNQCPLEELVIDHCPSLISFPGGELPTTLKRLRIRGWQKLEIDYWFLKRIMQCDAREMPNSHLEHLQVSHFSVTSFPTGKFPTSLKTLKISDFARIQSLPSLLNLSHLTQLIITNCDDLESFTDQELPLPNLTSLVIISCEKLRSLPNHMDSLQHLRIRGCSGLVSFPETGLSPKLISLYVSNCKNLRQPISEWRLHTLTSLQRLQIEFATYVDCFLWDSDSDSDSDVDYLTDVDYFPDDDGLLLPPSLISLRISNHRKLKSISSGIQHLTSLKELEFSNCPQLHVLPKEGFPATLEGLDIFNCPLLKERCLKEKGDYWPIIAHIPNVLSHP